MIGKFRIIIFAIIFFFFAGHSLAVDATERYRVVTGSSVDIDEWGVCQKVANASGWPDVFVPTKTEMEWTKFRENKPSHINLSDCEATIPSGWKVMIWFQYGCDPGHRVRYFLSELPQTFRGSADSITYTVSQVGNRIKINPHHYYAPFTPGGNVNAILVYRADDLGNIVEGMYAKKVVSYSLGANGIAASAYNVLGEPLEAGPYNYYGWVYYTLLGDGESEIVVSF